MGRLIRINPSKILGYVVVYAALAALTAMAAYLVYSVVILLYCLFRLVFAQ